MRRNHPSGWTGRVRSLWPALALSTALACGAPAPEQAAPAAMPAAATPKTGSTPAGTAATAELPRKPGSLRFAAIGDSGRGDRRQYETAAKMIEWRQWFDYGFVLMLGDNIYGPGSPEDYVKRFERPYGPLIEAGVPFYAAIGNHDPIGQEHYPLFNMGGQRYYAFEKEEGALAPLIKHKVLFVALDTVDLTRGQLAWVEQTLAESTADWKIAFYHHPLYTSGRYQFGAARIRAALEPIFVRQRLDVGFNGHEHFYERLELQRGIQYFTSGAGGALRIDDIRVSASTAAGFDTDTHFMLIEIAGDTLYFLVISRKGEVVDSGSVRKRDS